MLRIEQPIGVECETHLPRDKLWKDGGRAHRVDELRMCIGDVEAHRLRLWRLNCQSLIEPYRGDAEILCLYGIRAGSRASDHRNLIEVQRIGR